MPHILATRTESAFYEGMREERDAQAQTSMDVLRSEEHPLSLDCTSENQGVPTLNEKGPAGARSTMNSHVPAGSG